MEFLPPPGPARWRAIGLLVAITAIGAYYVPQVFSTDTPSAPVVPANPVGLPSPTGAATAPSNSKSATPAKKQGSEGPVPVNLASLEPADAAGPVAGRNPFRFGEPPRPPAPPPQPLPAYVPPPPTPPLPPPAPTVRLKLVGTMLISNGDKWQANFLDERGIAFTAQEGDIIDGRYRLIKIGGLDKSAVVSFLDGSGQTTIRVR